MVNPNSFMAASTGIVFAVIFTVISVLIFATVLFLLWWVDVKKKTVKDLGKTIGRGFMRFFGAIHDFFTANSSVKTVYSDKSLNYSGTEFLPVPTKAPTDKYTYEFVGWDKNGVDANGNTVVRAIYLQKVTRCYINVFDDDKQTLLHSAEVEYGAGVNLDGIKPKKQETKEFSYEFIGWDKDISAFYKHENIYAVYKAIPKKYTYTFLGEDEETVINQGTAIYGTPIVAPVAPKKESTSADVYMFAGWKGYEENMPLTRDINFVATYNIVPVNVEKNSTVVNDLGEKVKVANEIQEKVEVQQKQEPLKPQSPVFFKGVKDKEKDKTDEVITSITPRPSGILKKGGSGSSIVIQRNDMSETEKFQEKNRSDVFDNGDDEVHQRIQLMTIKKTASNVGKKTKVIKSVPKNEEANVVDETEALKNMMINKVKIDKKED